MMVEVRKTPQVDDDLRRLKKSGNKKAIERYHDLVNSIANNPLVGIGKPERLKGFGDRHIYSRRIDSTHRLIYEVLEQGVLIVSAYGHYRNLNSKN